MTHDTLRRSTPAFLHLIRNLLLPLRPGGIVVQGALIVLAAFSLTGCAGCFGWKQLPPPGPRPTAVVLDFAQAPRIVERRDTCRNLVIGEKDVETEKDRRGWWFGSQDVHYNANWGIIMADIMAEKLEEECIYDIRSRGDVKLYYADKKEVLAEQLGLEGEELDKAVLALNPVMIGREMGVEKVVVGQVIDAELRTNRTFGYFSSVASINVSVYDTATGQLEFTRDFSNWRGHSTTYGNLREIAEDMIISLKTLYNSRAVPAWQVR